MSQKATCKDTLNVISSLGSADGRKLSGLPSGQQIALFGQDRALVNHLAAQENKKEQKTQDTFGPNSTDLSPSANLTLSLGNRLKEQLEWVGSMEYSQTWKLKVTPAGRQYWAHIASTRRTSGKGRTGWPTPQAIDASGQGRQGRFKKDGNRNPNSTGSYRMDLKDAALLTGWPTPNTNNIKGAYQDDAKNIARMEAGRQVNLQDVARLAGWATPTVQDSANTAGRSQFRRNSLPLNCEATLVPGQIQYGFPAPTEKRGVLNPNHSRWLMGYRAEWGSCGATAMQSCRR